MWQADFFHSPTFISNADVGVERPWAAIVMDRRSGFVLSNELLRGEPTPDALWDNVVRSMAHPGPRAPMRPSVVEVSDSDGYDFLKPQLNRLGVECVLSDELPELHAFCRMLAAGLVKGGSHRLSSALYRSFVRDGGRVLDACEAARILVNSGAVVGVETAAGQRFSARCVVCVDH